MCTTIEGSHRLEFTLGNPYRGVHTKDKVNTTFDKRVSVELSTLPWGLGLFPLQYHENKNRTLFAKSVSCHPFNTLPYTPSCPAFALRAIACACWTGLP